MSNINYEVHDTRTVKEFKGITFSNFKLCDVRNELLNTLLHSKLESSWYWCAEMICSGKFFDLWNILLLFMSKYIHIGNPKLPIYIELRVSQFKDIINNGYNDNILLLRNNEKIRKMFSEIIYILINAKRKHSYDTIKINNKDFDITNVDKFKADNVNYATKIIKDNDPNDIYIVINDIMYHISEKIKDEIRACYWIEWLIEFQILCKKKKEDIVCERRINIPVDIKYQQQLVWVIWDCLINESLTRDKVTQKIINSLLSLFTIKYKTTLIKKRKYILYFAVSILCLNNNKYCEIITSKQKEIINKLLDNTDFVYKEIKNNEVIDDDTNNLPKNNNQIQLKKTIEKLGQLNDFEEKFIPRI